MSDCSGKASWLLGAPSRVPMTLAKPPPSACACLRWSWLAPHSSACRSTLCSPAAAPAAPAAPAAAAPPTAAAAASCCIGPARSGESSAEALAEAVDGAVESAGSGGSAAGWPKGWLIGWPRPRASADGGCSGAGALRFLDSIAQLMHTSPTPRQSHRRLKQTHCYYDRYDYDYDYYYNYCC